MKKQHSWRIAVPLVCCCLFSLMPYMNAASLTVNIRNFSFQPQQIEIEPGDTITWRQQDSVAHTSTSGEDGVPDGVWDSGNMNPGETFSRTFTTPGTFPYFCIPHPFMMGTVIVKPAQATLPTVSITSPSNNATVAPGDLTIEASASVQGGTIARVEFFNGATKLGEDASSPYSITVSLQAGTHTFTAKAITNNDASATSDPVTVVVGTNGEAIENPFPERIAKGDFTIEVQTIADGLISPLGMAVPDDGSGRWLVYDQAGFVYAFQNGTKMEAPFLDLRDRLIEFRNYDERGLLGLATHPKFQENPLVYTYSSEPVGRAADFTVPLPEGASMDHQSVIAEWRVDPNNPHRIDPASRREILRIDQPQRNHNAGTMRFGPDGFLYIALGDGGAADDQGAGHVPEGNGQAKDNIHGNLLRIDVNGRSAPNGQYAIPADNPFVGQDGLDEIYAYGFRNPYAFSFDRLTGELLLADVGQNKIEELNRVFKGGNYGWPIKEGAFFFDPNGSESGFITTRPVRQVPAGLIDPIAQYDHDDGLAIVNGFVYRGKLLPNLLGRFIAGDWGSFSSPTGRLFFLDRSEFKEFRIGRDDRSLGLWLKGFGQDEEGEIYVFGSTDLGPSGTSGRMLKLVPISPKIEITAATRSGNDLSITWTNGVGPFLLQSTRALGQAFWKTIAGVKDPSASVSLNRSEQFFRVADLAGNGPIPFTATLSGAAERPQPVTTDATGSGTFSLEGNTLHFDLHYTGLSGQATAAHIHGPATTADSAGVLINLAPFNGGAFGTSGSLSGSINLSSEHKALLLAGKTYVNIHTPANPGGEIRGQILPVAFGARLMSAAERPNPVMSSGEGSAIFLLAGNELSIQVIYQNLLSAAVGAHIHGPATDEEAANILVDLQPLHDGPFARSGRFAGTVTLTPEQLAHLGEGLTYVNIHTAENPPGEIRGQILPQPAAIPVSAALSGAAERPDPVTTTALGSAALLLEGSHLRFVIQYRGLSGPASAAHIHGPATAAQPAGVLINLAPFIRETGASGSFAGTVELTDEIRAWIVQGLTYVNVHTAANPGGEIRGQIAPVLWQSTLRGASERPQSVQTVGRGTGTLLLIRDRLHFNITYAGLSGDAAAAHIHGPAGHSEAANVLINLQPFHQGPFSSSGSFAGAVALSSEVLAAFLDGRTYLNIHTPENPGGEIRGQIQR